MNIFRAVLSSSNLPVTSAPDSLESPNSLLGTVVSIARSVLFGRKRGCEEDTVPGTAKVHRAEMPIPPSYLDPDRNRFPRDILQLITNYLSNSDIKKLPLHALVDTINTKKIGLKALGIETRQETATWLKSLGKVREALSYLDLSDIPLTAELIALLPSSLQELKCCKCALTDKAVAALSARCTKLLKLDVSRNSLITGNAFDHLPEGLQELKCCNCALTDKAVAALSARCTKLLKLNVSWNIRITGNTFDHLPEGLQVLECSGAPSPMKQLQRFLLDAQNF